MVELTPTQPHVLSVWELTRTVRACLEEGIGEIWVEGEISNYRKQSSGHQYFTLKDDRSQLPCVFFRNTAAANGAAVPLADGMRVQVHGDLTVYESRGQYQLVVGLVQGRGVGALQARFEALKRKLYAEGLFDPARKQELPAFPLTVGIVTSPTGAALQDMLNILRRRAPWMRVLVHPVRVQGQGASLEIVNAVQEFNAWAQAPGEYPSKKVDLIVVARGGGSIEDLWEFNEEIVARAIAASALPVVSAVGHEIDFTIADFAADLRAPTPSAAAELIAPDTAALRERLDAAAESFERELRDRVERARERLETLASGSLEREPRRRLLDARQRLDLAQEDLGRAALASLRLFRGRLEEKGGYLRTAGLQQSLELRTQLVSALREKLGVLVCCEQAQAKARLHAAEGLLRVLGPQATLERGYSVAMHENGHVIRNVDDVRAGQIIITRLRDGSLSSVSR